MKLNARQRDRLIGLLESTPWGDIANSLMGVEIVLGLLLEATRHDFLIWESEAEEAGRPDEYDISATELARMPDRLRRGYLARHIRNIALGFGLDIEFGRQPGIVDRSRRDALAPLLRDLVEIATPSGDEEIRTSLEGLDRALDAADRDLAHRAWYLTKAEVHAERLLADIRREQGRDGGTA